MLILICKSNIAFFSTISVLSFEIPLYILFCLLWRYPYYLLCSLFPTSTLYSFSHHCSSQRLCSISVQNTLRVGLYCLLWSLLSNLIRSDSYRRRTKCLRVPSVYPCCEDSRKSDWWDEFIEDCTKLVLLETTDDLNHGENNINQ